MKKEIAFAAFMSALVVTGCGKSESNSDLALIKVAENIGKSADLKVSQIGSSIAYVPLETSDSSLIANNYILDIIGDKVIVANFNQEPAVMAFDLATGKYLHKISGMGSGPEEYANPYFLTDAAHKSVFLLPSNRNGLLRFDTDGNFTGRVIEGVRLSPAMTATDSTFTLAGNHNMEGSQQMTFLTYDFKGNLIDSVSAFCGEKMVPYPNSYTGYTDWKRFSSPIRHSSKQIAQCINNDKTTIYAQDYLYYAGNDVHLFRNFNDTIYSVSSNSVVPSTVFDMGEHSFTLNDLNTIDPSSDKIIVTDIVESPDKVVFTVSQGWLADDGHKEYIGVYDRLTGNTGLAPISQGITDDLTGFMPFMPLLSTVSGKMVGLIGPEDVAEWLEENPGAQIPAELANMKDDDNPILVIVE